MKKLLLSAFIIFGSAQLFIQSVVLFSRGGKLQAPPSQSTSNINSDLPVKVKKPTGTLNNILKFETGIPGRVIAHDFNFTVLPYNIAKINGLQLFNDPGMNLNSFGLFNTYNWRWRLVE